MITVMVSEGCRHLNFNSNCHSGKNTAGTLCTGGYGLNSTNVVIKCLHLVIYWYMLLRMFLVTCRCHHLKSSGLKKDYQFL